MQACKGNNTVQSDSNLVLHNSNTPWVYYSSIVAVHTMASVCLCTTLVLDCTPSFSPPYSLYSAPITVYTFHLLRGTDVCVRCTPCVLCCAWFGVPAQVLHTCEGGHRRGQGPQQEPQPQPEQVTPTPRQDQEQEQEQVPSQER